MTTGFLNPADNDRTSSTRPAEANTGAGLRKWYNGTLKTRPKAQDLNRILALFRDVIDYYDITDVEGDDTLLRQVILAAAPTRLTAATTYYVRTDGSDSNDGLTNSAGGAFLTIQKAVDVATLVNNNGKSITIQVADGTYDAGATIIGLATISAGAITIQGNTVTPGNCVINAVGSVAFLISNSMLTIQGFKVTSSGAHQFQLVNQSIVTFGAMEFGSAGTNYTQISAASNVAIQFNSSYTISGGAAHHMNLSNGSVVLYNGAITATLSGSPAFTQDFVNLQRGSTLDLRAAVFSGAATGLKYQMDDSSIITVTGALDPNSVLPGSINGGSLPRYNSAKALRNLLLNGAGKLQLGPSGTVADDSYGLHNRWYALTQSGAITPSTVADAADGLPSMMRLTNTFGSAQRYGYAQIIKGADCKRFRNSPVNLSGVLRRNAATAVRFAILEWTGTEDAVTSDVVATWSSTSWTPGGFFAATNLTVVATGTLTPGANALTPFTLTGNLSSSFNNLIVFIWNQTTVATSDTLDFIAQLEQGTQGSAFEHRPLSLELAECAMYYQAKTVRSENGSRHIPLAHMQGIPVVNVGVGAAANITPDGFELTHTAAADCTVTASAEL